MANVKASLAKAAMGSLLAGSVLLGSVPASAQYRDYRYDRRGDGISAGEVIAGAVVIGGLAAILSSVGKDRYDDRYRDGRYNDRYNNGRYNDQYAYGYDQRYGGSRQAVQQCVNAAEQQASYRGGRADVTQITNIDRTRDGYRIEGRIGIDDAYGRYDRYDRRNGYDRYDRYDRRGYDDTGRFTCSVRYGRVDDLRLRGIG